MQPMIAERPCMFSLRATLPFLIVFAGMIGCDYGLISLTISGHGFIGLYNAVGLKGIIVFFVMAFIAPFVCWYLGFTYQIFEGTFIRFPLFGLFQKQLFYWGELEKVIAKPSLENPKALAMYFRGHKPVEVPIFYFGFNRLLVFLVTRYQNLITERLI